MKQSLVPLLLVLGGFAAHAETLNIDPVHSAIGFKVRHLFTQVPGKFAEVTGTIEVDPEHPEKAMVDATIKATSIETGNEKRDTHLRSPDFFDVAKFPAITFKSKKVSVTGKDTADVSGDLTMHGVTKEAVLHVKFLGKGPNMGGGTTTGWEAKTMLNRQDFGLSWSKLVEGTAVVADDVEVELQIAANSK